MKKGLLIALVFCCGMLSAQDLHFTQFQFAPLQLNPAQTGFYNADYRVGLNFKQQWPWARNNRLSNYRSLSFYGDMALLKKRLPGKDWMGGGLVFFNDNAGDGNLSVNKIGLSAAYHKVLGKFTLSGGVGIHLVQKRVEYSELYFDAQWQEDAFDTGLPNLEDNQSDQVIFADLHAGAQLSYRFHEDLNINFGVGLMHLNKPRESFYGFDNRLGIRPAVHAGSFWQIRERYHIEPAIYYSAQKRAQEVVTTLLAGFHPQTGGNIWEESIFYLGAAFRSKDALVPMIGYQYKKWKGIVNYDVNLSQLRAASGGVGGIEFSIVYLGIKPINEMKVRIPCPRL